MRSPQKGFTLLEIVMVIAITAMLTVALFEALDRIRRNEARFREKQTAEKEIYLLFNGLTAFFKNLSQYTVYNNREESLFFKGDEEGLICLTHSPLLAPGNGVRFAELRFNRQSRQLLYREKDFRRGNAAKGVFISFAELDQEPFFPLLENIRTLQFVYHAWDGGNRRFEWKKQMDSFQRDNLPRQILLRVDSGGRMREMNFRRLIRDDIMEIPPEKLR